MTGADPVAANAFAAIADAVGDLVTAFSAAGHRLYLVGGAVRDVLVAVIVDGPDLDGPELDGRDLDWTDLDWTDLDFTTAAHPDEIARLVRPYASAVWTQGERFGTIGAMIDDRLVEITTHRAEAYDPSSRKPVVTFGETLEDDLARRDFTINAIAVSLPDGRLVDPHGGKADLDARVLRTPLAPDVSFSDDPLRMLRAARFLARFRLEPATELVAAAQAGADRLGIVSAERVQAELEKQLAVDDVGTAFAFLDATGLLDRVLPELGAVPAMARAEALALVASPGSNLVRRAGLLSPIGPAARKALGRLRYSRDGTVATVRLLEALPHTVTDDVDDRTVRRVVDSIGLERCGELIQLGDNVRRHRELPGPNPFRTSFDRLAEREDLADLDAPVGGGFLIAELGIEPGPIVGQAIAFLKSCRLDDGPMTAAEALAKVSAWLPEATG